MKERLEGRICKMEFLYSSCVQEVQPSRISYKRDVLQKAQEILDQMESNAVQFDVVTYTTYLNILANSKSPNKVEKADDCSEK